jgi:hypothetical protein
MGRSGNACTATPRYLHFEVRKNGLLTGTRFNPGQMKACVGGPTPVNFPRAIEKPGDDFDSWNDVPWRDAANYSIPRATNNCVPASAATANRPGSTRGKFGDEKAVVRWADPNIAVNGVVVSMQVWRPSFDDWSKPAYRHLGKTARKTTFSNLINGRPYRFRVAYHNGIGYSAWGSYVKVTPAAPPDTPRSPRSLNSDPDSVSYSWYRTKPNGRDVKGYQVAIRRQKGGSWTDWKKAKVGDILHHRWDGLRSGKTYQVKVRALSAAGPSDWSRRSRISTT